MTLAQDVTPESVSALLLARAPGILQDGDPNHDLYLQLVEGIVDEVAAIVGDDPQPGPRRRLALRAIAYGTAAEIEEGLYPEQQQGEDARAVYLRGRYAELLAALRSDLDADGVTDTVPAPRANFPAALPYPDPAMRYERRPLC